MFFPSTHTILNEDETTNLANKFSKVLKIGDLVVLNGNLGTGKTFFVKKVLETFAVYNVSSPTFAIVNQYVGKEKYYHLDFYRIEKINELYDIGIEEYLNDADSISFIEWGNLFADILPKKRIEINFTLNSDLSRSIEFIKYEWT